MYPIFKKTLPLVLLSGATLLGGCVAHRGHAIYVYAPTPPPIHIRETIGHAPGRGYVWIAGHHRWEGREYEWVPGHWERVPRHRSHWVSGRWHHDRHGWFWVEGRWS